MNNFDSLGSFNNARGPKFKRREISYPKPAEVIKPETSSISYKPKRPWKLLFSFGIIIVILIIAFSSNIIFSSSSLLNNLTNLNSENTSIGLWGRVKRLVGAEEKSLKGEADDRINILLLGQGGLGHEGPFLTDTIILASYKPSTNQVAAISIPRDLYVPIYNNGWLRINHANSIGETDMGGKGGETASQTISNVFELPIHYYARIDFKGFKEIINDLGGINVYVDRSFTDPTYPTSDYGTTTISFDTGWQKMDGDTALKFARSRHGTNGEAGDFARAKRQQKILMAIKDKAFSFGSLFRPDKFIKAAKDFNKHFETNLKTWEMIRLSKFAKDIDLNNIITKTMDDSPQGPLMGGITEEGAYVLMTKTEDFTELSNIAKNIFGNPTEAQIKKVAEDRAEKNALTKKIKQEGGYANIIVQNGTLRSGLAKRSADYLASLELTVLKFGNAGTQDIEKTTIYDFTNGKKEANLELLENEVEAKSKKSDLSDFPDLDPKTDFLIILGLNYTEPIMPNVMSATTSKGPQIPTSTNENE